MATCNEGIFYHESDNVYWRKNQIADNAQQDEQGWGATVTEGWYLKLTNDSIPEDQKSLEKLCNYFEEAFILKTLQDQAHQTIYSLSMDQFQGDFDQYTTAFRLAQACSGIKADNILVATLQWGVTNQLATMMTSAALPIGQEKNWWKWEKELDKAGEFYQNMVRLRKLRGGGDSYIQQAQPARSTCPPQDPYAMDVDKINLSPSEQAEHMHNWKCFICHNVGCHSSKHAGYPKGRKPPQQNFQPSRHFQRTKEVTTNPRVATNINQKGVTPEQALSLLGTCYGEEGTQEWPTEEESVAKVSAETGF